MVPRITEYVGRFISGASARSWVLNPTRLAFIPAPARTKVIAQKTGNTNQKSTAGEQEQGCIISGKVQNKAVTKDVSNQKSRTEGKKATGYLACRVKLIPVISACCFTYYVGQCDLPVSI